MPENKSLLVGIFEVKWDGKNLTFSTLNETYKLSGQEGYDLLNWLYDEHRQDLYAAAHPQQQEG